MNNEQYDLLIIGGGASGLMAAVVATEQGSRVLVLEKNQELGVKLAITGGGRCNIMNSEPDVRKLLAEYDSAGKFLFSPFAQFSLDDTRAFFESRGLTLKTEDRQRVFPASEKASDVVVFFTSLLQRDNVTIRTNETVTGFTHEAGMITGAQTQSGTYTAKRYILATGGLSRPETGSTGDGHEWLKELGHTVHDPDPALVPLISPDRWVHNLAGTSLEQARITFENAAGKCVKTGRILFTHFGLSGPTIINAAAEVRTLLKDGPVSASINLFPGVDDALIHKKVLHAFTEYSNKTLRNTIKQIVPAGMSNAVLSLLSADVADTKTHSITKADRLHIIALLRALPLTITDTKSNDWSVVANGGLDLTEVDTRTMQSKRYPNLFVTGDILHITRPTGGYSLQLCWTTGAVAAMNAVE